jgi:hypothetical protein
VRSDQGPKWARRRAPCMEGALLERWLAQCFDETHYTRSRNIAYFLDRLHLASGSQGRRAASLNHAARHDVSFAESTGNGRSRRRSLSVPHCGNAKIMWIKKAVWSRLLKETDNDSKSASTRRLQAGRRGLRDGAQGQQDGPAGRTVRVISCHSSSGCQGWKERLVRGPMIEVAQVPRAYAESYW